MPLEKLKKEVYLRLEEIFTVAVVDEMTGDDIAYKKKLELIARIAEILGVDTEITTTVISIKPGSGECERAQEDEEL